MRCVCLPIFPEAFRKDDGKLSAVSGALRGEGDGRLPEVSDGFRRVSAKFRRAPAGL